MPDLLPAPAGLQIEDAVVDGSSVTIVVRTTAPTALCPDCGVASAAFTAVTPDGRRTSPGTAGPPDS